MPDLDQLPALLLLSRGWNHEAWIDFYPPDLPPEWRLGYYSNEFRAVLIPEAVWRGQPEPALWLAEVNDQFLFYLECQRLDRQGLDLIEQAVQNLGGQLGGILLTSKSAGPLASSVVRMAADYGIICIAPEGGLDCEMPCWTDSPSQLLENPAVCCFIMGPDRSIDLKLLRSVVAMLAKRGLQGHPSLLVINGEPPDFQRLTECRTLLELMAIA